MTSPLAFLIFTALVNIHHFILDGAIWKLRDGRIATLLLNSRDRISERRFRSRKPTVADGSLADRGNRWRAPAAG